MAFLIAAALMFLAALLVVLGIALAATTKPSAEGIVQYGSVVVCVVSLALACLSVERFTIPSIITILWLLSFGQFLVSTNTTTQLWIKVAFIGVGFVVAAFFVIFLFVPTV
jgi:hypothetical protein